MSGEPKLTLVEQAFTLGCTEEAEAAFQKQLRAEKEGVEPCYFCGSWEHWLTECPDKP